MRAWLREIGAYYKITAWINCSPRMHFNTRTYETKFVAYQSGGHARDRNEKIQEIKRTKQRIEKIPSIEDELKREIPVNWLNMLSDTNH